MSAFTKAELDWVAQGNAALQSMAASPCDFDDPLATTLAKIILIQMGEVLNNMVGVVSDDLTSLAIAGDLLRAWTVQAERFSVPSEAVVAMQLLCDHIEMVTR